MSSAQHTRATAEFHLEVLDDSGRVRQDIPCSGAVRVGRVSPDAPTPDVPVPAEHTSASRQHAVIEAMDSRVVLTDQSRLGTLVNGEKVHGRSVDLHDGDEIVFGVRETGWRVRFRAGAGPPRVQTEAADALEVLVVSDTPRRISVGRIVIEEHLGDRAFRLLKFLAENRGNWYPTERLAEVLWPDPDNSPYQTRQALARSKKRINDLLRSYLEGHDAIESQPFRGYRMKPRLGGG